MPFDREQPEPFNPKSKPPGAADLNRMIKGGRRQIGGPNVSDYGDRTIINQPRDRSYRPTTSHYDQKFVVLQVYDDYLLCKVIEFEVLPSGWWQAPNYEEPTAQPTYKFVNVAKPDEIRRSFWDGKTIPINGVDTTYNFVAEGKRTATTGSGNVDEFLTPLYYPGAIINAIKGFTGVNDNDSHPIMWTDANTAGRNWDSNKESSTGVFIKITSSAGPAPYSDCLPSYGNVGFPQPQCGFFALPGIVAVTPMGSGIFKVGEIYRAWKVATGVYVSKPDPTVPPPDDCVYIEYGEICLIREEGVVVGARQRRNVIRGCTTLSTILVDVPDCVLDSGTGTGTGCAVNFCLTLIGVTGNFAVFNGVYQFVLVDPTAYPLIWQGSMTDENGNVFTATITYDGMAAYLVFNGGPTVTYIASPFDCNDDNIFVQFEIHIDDQWPETLTVFVGDDCVDDTGTGTEGCGPCACVLDPTAIFCVSLPPLFTILPDPSLPPGTVGDSLPHGLYTLRPLSPPFLELGCTFRQLGAAGCWTEDLSLYFPLAKGPGFINSEVRNVALILSCDPYYPDDSYYYLIFGSNGVPWYTGIAASYRILKTAFSCSSGGVFELYQTLNSIGWPETLDLRRYPGCAIPRPPCLTGTGTGTGTDGCLCDEDMLFCATSTLGMVTLFSAGPGSCVWLESATLSIYGFFPGDGLLTYGSIPSNYAQYSGPIGCEGGTYTKTFSTGNGPFPDEFVIYPDGCPIWDDCPDCPDGTPDTITFTYTGFGMFSVYAPLNGSWTLNKDPITPCLWTSATSPTAYPYWSLYSDGDLIATLDALNQVLFSPGSYWPNPCCGGITVLYVGFSGQNPDLGPGQMITATATGGNC